MAALSGRGHARRWMSRVGWLVLIWAVSVTALGAAAWLMKWLMRAGGLTS